MDVPAEVVITLLRRQLAEVQWQNTLLLAELYAAGLRSDETQSPPEVDNVGE
jgi:hypothetical protein